MQEPRGVTNPPGEGACGPGERLIPAAHAPAGSRNKPTLPSVGSWVQPGAPAAHASWVCCSIPPVPCTPRGRQGGSDDAPTNLSTQAPTFSLPAFKKLKNIQVLYQLQCSFAKDKEWKCPTNSRRGGGASARNCEGRAAHRTRVDSRPASRGSPTRPLRGRRARTLGAPGTGDPRRPPVAHRLRSRDSGTRGPPGTSPFRRSLGVRPAPGCRPASSAARECSGSGPEAWPTSPRVARVTAPAALGPK